MLKLVLLPILLVAACDATTSCKRDYDMLGCYEESTPGTMLLDDRTNIVWTDIEGYMRSLACKCSKIAKERGYDGFAMHFWGECYGRTAVELAALSGAAHKSHKCVGNQKYTHCDVSEHEHCTGMDYAEAVYKFKSSAEENVNGGLGEWEPWTPCDKTCGSGVQVRERNCDNPVPKGTGKDCSELGPLSQTKLCKIAECPVNGGWSSYGSWGSCSRSCGGGVKYRERSCNNPAPTHGGSNCVGAARESAACNTHMCPVNGGWSSYASWVSCSKSCGGGVKYRFRSCTNPAPQHGGSECLGSSSESASCNTNGCPVNGGWSSYGSYGSCSRSCGGGVKYRYRSCTNPAPKHGGSSCLGSSSQSASCNTNGCPVNGGWSSYGSWGSCSRSCGGGVKYRHRSCNNPAPKNGGSSCSGSTSQSASCNTNGCPVNGGWSSFGSYGGCNRLCGGGTMYRHRSCNSPSPQNGGANCAGSSSQSSRCNTNVCPAINSCSYKYTTYQTHSGGNMVYIDRHRMNCGGPGQIMSMFHLQRNGGSMRYQFSCCTIQGSCTLHGQQSSYNDDGSGNAVFLDRHTADCGTNGFINDFRVERNSGHNKVRYNYYCCKLPSTWTSRASCYTGYTGFTDDGGGKVYYLDRQTVSCNAGYALSYFKLERNSSHNKVRYYYRCCKVNY